MGFRLLQFLIYYVWGLSCVVIYMSYCVENNIDESKDDDDVVLFNRNYNVIWGKNHTSVLRQGREVRLTMDKHSGSGFQSKAAYGSGFFRLKIKLTNKDSAGVVTAFYLISRGRGRYGHDELDIEFLGNRAGQPILIQTNVFVNGYGNKEQRTRLWFDPTADFHSYKILWNHYHVVFYVDNTPIRVFKNKGRSGGANMYLGRRAAMRIEASIWDGDSWATEGGRIKTNWSHAPFSAYFQDFSIDACSTITKSSPSSSSDISTCSSSKYWWNHAHYWTLPPNQHKLLQHVRDNYLIYDYCNDPKRFPTPPLECSYNT